MTLRQDLRILSHLVFAAMFMLGCGGEGNNENLPEGPEGTWIAPATGLMWQEQGESNNGHGFSWQQAKDYCTNLNLGGYSDWRLPTISELRSLIRGCSDTVTGGACGVTDDCLNGDKCWNNSCVTCDEGKGPSNGCYWPNNLQGECGGYWSASTPEDVSACLVVFSNGAISSAVKANTFNYVRCVRQTQ